MNEQFVIGIYYDMLDTLWCYHEDYKKLIWHFQDKKYPTWMCNVWWLGNAYKHLKVGVEFIYVHVYGHLSINDPLTFFQYSIYWAFSQFKMWSNLFLSHWFIHKGFLLTSPAFNNWSLYICFIMCMTRIQEKHLYLSLIFIHHDLHLDFFVLLYYLCCLL